MTLSQARIDEVQKIKVKLISSHYFKSQTSTWIATDLKTSSKFKCVELKYIVSKSWKYSIGTKLPIMYYDTVMVLLCICYLKAWQGKVTAWYFNLYGDCAI